jgi:hypothetical protein
MQIQHTLCRIQEGAGTGQNSIVVNLEDKLARRRYRNVTSSVAGSDYGLNWKNPLGRKTLLTFARLSGPDPF